MSYFVVLDSCGELTEEMKSSGHFANAPLTIDVDDYHIVDDDTFDQKEFLRRAAASPNAPHSACPSPQTWKELFDKDPDAEHIFGVTLSAELSGSYNSALIGRDMLLEEQPQRQVYIFNSRSASIGETLIGMKIRECEEKHMSFQEIIEAVEHYIASQVTWFVLESLEALRKNGRLSSLKAKVATVLNIKPVMTSTPKGTIAQLCQQRGINRALKAMVENIVQTVEKPQEKILAISHCNCKDRALMIRDALMERLPLKQILVLDTRGISSLYASDGGVIVVV